MWNIEKHISHKVLAWLVWTIAVVYYLYEYIQRISPSVMVGEIMHAFSIDTTVMGNLGAIYFYVYGVMQIPVGILVDNYGPKRPLLTAVVLISIGSFIFSASNSLTLSYISRGLVGFGSSFGYLCCLKIIVNWFESRRFAFMCSLVNMVGMVGAFVGEISLSFLMKVLSWRELLFYLSFVGIVIVVLVALFVRNFPRNKYGELPVKIFDKPKGFLKDAFKQILTSKQILFTAIFVAFMYCTFDTIAALWGTTYLETVYGVTRVSAAEISSLIFLGAIVGYPLLGWLTSVLHNQHKKIMIGAGICMVIVSLLIWSMPHNLNVVRLLFFLLGVCAGSTATATALAKESMPLKISGITMSVVNTALVLLGASSQPIFGYLLELHQKIASSNIHSLSVQDFHRAFLLMPCLYAIALLCSFFVKQPKQQVV